MLQICEKSDAKHCTQGDKNNILSNDCVVRQTKTPKPKVDMTLGGKHTEASMDSFEIYYILNKSKTLFYTFSY